MKIKKRTLKSAAAIMFIITFSALTYNMVLNARINTLISQKNQFCNNMSSLLSADQAIEECYCYYQGFITGNEEMDSKTDPVCACDCIINGTTYSIGLVEPTI